MPRMFTIKPKKQPGLELSNFVPNVESCSSIPKPTAKLNSGGLGFGV